MPIASFAANGTVAAGDLGGVGSRGLVQSFLSPVPTDSAVAHRTLIPRNAFRFAMRWRRNHVEKHDGTSAPAQALQAHLESWGIGWFGEDLESGAYNEVIKPLRTLKSTGLVR